MARYGSAKRARGASLRRVSEKAIDSDRAIRGWRLTACREAVGISSVAKLAEHIRRYASESGHPPPHGFSARTLNAIEAGREALPGGKADYIADACGVSRSFFTAPPERLGDVQAGAEAVGRTVSITPYADLLSQRAAVQHALADEALAALDAARRGAPRQSTQEDQRSEQRRSA